MNLNRRDFLTLSLGVAAAGCCSTPCCCKLGRPAVQLYSIREYIGGKRDPKTKKYDGTGVGLEKALDDVAKIGYEAVEFAGYYDFSAKDLARMLKNSGLKACGTHINRLTFAPDEIKKTIEFNLEYGNAHLICPGSGMWPTKDHKGTMGDWWRKMVEFYNVAAETANQYGCTLGYHNHTDEFVKRTAMEDGTLMWDYFFSNTKKNVCMEMDVGWTTCAGQDPCFWFEKFPGRSPTLHAKENAGFLDANQKRSYAPIFEGILGQPGKFEDGKSVTPVAWDRLFKASDAAGVKWYVVECERNAANLHAITESLKFLKSKGRV